VTEANDYVRIGAFHTLELEREYEYKCDPPVSHDAQCNTQNLADALGGKQFRLTKATGWDSISLAQIEEATAPGRGAEIGAVVCGEGTAAICLMSENMTVVRQRIECPVPRKRSGTSSHDKVG
jgi:protein pelota